MAELRIGKVSSIDYEHGMIRVVYADRDNAVTKPLPVLTFNDEYKMPKVGQYVLVGHLSNGTEAAYVMGTFWNTANEPGRSGKGVYRKEFAHKTGEAYIDYDEEAKKLLLKGDTITFTCSAGTITLAEIIQKLG